jgi:hypothetical protein
MDLCIPSYAEDSKFQIEYSGKIPKDSRVPPPTPKSKSILFFNISENNPITIEAAKMMTIPREDLAKSGNKPVNGVKKILNQPSILMAKH